MATLNEILHVGETFRRILEEFPFLPPYHTWKLEGNELHQEVSGVPLRIRFSPSTDRDGTASTIWNTIVGDQICVRTARGANWTLCWRNDHLRDALLALQEDLWHVLRKRKDEAEEAMEALHPYLFPQS